MEQKTVLLLNVVAIQLISIFSDYWIAIKFKTVAPPNCHFQAHNLLSRLECGNISYTLVRQHANLFRQCNDISEGYRRNLSRSGLFYADPCHWFVMDRSYSLRRRVQTNLFLDIFSLFMSISSPICGLLGYFLCTTAEGVIRALSAATLASLIPIVTTMFIIHSTNTQEPQNEEEFLYYTESDWSLLCAVMGFILMGLTTHICMVQHRRVIERQLSQRRRRQLHNALMSSCRQDIAMAIRARMTVI